MDYTALAKRLLSADPKRSSAFIAGMAAVLHNRAEDVPVVSPFAEGSVEDDAFFAGRMRGHNEFRNLVEEEGGSRPAAVARLRAMAEQDRRAA